MRYKNCRIEEYISYESMPFGSPRGLPTETVCMGNHNRKNERCLVKDYKDGKIRILKNNLTGSISYYDL